MADERVDKPLDVLAEACEGWPTPNRYTAALAQARKDHERVIYIAEHLWQMVPQEVWRESGAEYYGQYEGDHWAEKVQQELKFHREQLEGREDEPDVRKGREV